MNKITRIAIMGATAIALGTGATVPAMAQSESTSGPTTILSGSSTQSNGGLTCHNQWFTRHGSTNCTGNSNQRWRLKLVCQAQGDITLPAQNGPGSAGADCNFRISSANIVWG